MKDGLLIHWWHALVSRRSLARILSTFLCCIIIVVRPFSHFGSSLAFLVLTVKELVFSVQENLAEQFEATILNIMGAFIGIGFSTVAKYIASLQPDDSVVARSIVAVFLVAIAFFGDRVWFKGIEFVNSTSSIVAGLLKSRLPRLQLSARISCFISIWLLTAEVGYEHNVLKDAGNFLWITISAAVTSLFSSMLLLRWSSTHFAEQVAVTFSAVRKCFSASLDTTFFNSAEFSSFDDDEMHNQLLQRSTALNGIYSQAVFELRIGRVGGSVPQLQINSLSDERTAVKSIKDMIGIIEQIRRELSWGMSLQKKTLVITTPEGQEILKSRAPVLSLGYAILNSMTVVEKALRTTFQHASIRRRSVESEKQDISSATKRLMGARDAAQDVLCQICGSWDTGPTDPKKLPQRTFGFCVFMTSVLQMTYEMCHALQIAGDMVALYEKSSPRLWHPHLSWSWFGVAPRALVLEEERGTFFDEDAFDILTDLSVQETKQGLAEQSTKSTNNRADPLSRPHDMKCRECCAAHLAIYHLWNWPAVLRVRLHLSRLIRATQHSPHLRHAVKNAAGVALLSFAAFLPDGSSGRRWFNSVHGQWMVISYVWVLETNTGATWRVGYLRLSGTAIGAFYAYITWLICHRNAYGLVAMATAAEIPISWVIINTRFPSLGVVASVTLPPIIFSQYLFPDPSISELKLAFLRGLMIGAGIIGALLMNSLVFPRHCRVLFLNNASRTLGYLSQLYLALSRDLTYHIHSGVPSPRHKKLKLELQIRDDLHRLSSLMTIMNDELSLLPKPMRHYRQVVRSLQRVLDLMTGLRKIRENISRPETVTPVFQERCEFVSRVCLSLFACEHVFRARQPLPQFLPDARQALIILETHLEEHIHKARNEGTSSRSLSSMYTLAEIEVMKDLVDALDDLLELSRQLFGTSTWLSRKRPSEAIANEPADGNVEWL